jgi:hypothetical protein
MFRSVRELLVAVAAVALLTGSVAAQDMTTSDVQRLQQTADQIGADIVTLRQRDRAAARSLQSELDDLEEEIIYLKVKLRRERSVPRADYMDVRDRLDKLRSRVTGTDTYSGRYGTANDRSTPTSTVNVPPGTIPAGTEIDLRLETRLSSDNNKVEDRFDATTIVDLRQDGRVVIPAGSRVRGVVTDVDDAGRIERKGRLSLSFDQLTISGRNYPIRGSVTQALEAGGYREDAGKIGTGAAVGGIIGGILGGLRGAITGILIGGGGVVAATEGQNVELPVGTVLRMRFDQDLNTRR